MPTNLSVSNYTIPKKFRLTTLLILSPILFFGQSLTGLWTGALSNDSSTVRKDQSFEIALTEYRGKVYGYSRSEFIVDDTLYYVVKRVKGTIEGDVCEVTDDEIIAYNFRGKLDKGIKVTSIFRRNQNDSTWYLDGTWKTNATKKYYAVTGKVNLEEEKDLTASKIFPHLEELKLADDIAFYKERKEGTPIVKLVKPEKIKTEYSTKTTPLANNTLAAITKVRPDLQRAEARPVPVTSSSETVSTTPAITPDAVVVSPESVTNKETTDTKEEIAAVKKTSVDLPKIDKKEIPESSVTLTRSLPVKTITENKTPAVASVQVIPAVDETVTHEQKEKKQESVTLATKNNSATSASPVAETKPIKTEPVARTTAKREPIVVKSKDINPQQTQNDTKEVVQLNNRATSTKPAAETKKPDIASTNSDRTNAVVANNPAPEKKLVNPLPITASVYPEKDIEKKPVVDILVKSALIAGRKSEFTQIVSFKSDSLQLSLYDNGEIDGDTVSVFMNGEVILSKQGLKASAIKKTIYITPGNEDFTLVLFAENLGKYPPNTGLLVVHDGADVYNLRFSSDFQKNAGIVFRKKKN